MTPPKFWRIDFSTDFLEYKVMSRERPLKGPEKRGGGNGDDDNRKIYELPVPTDPQELRDVEEGLKKIERVRKGFESLPER